MLYERVVVTPVLQALILAEKVYRTDTGQYILCGTFGTVEVAPAPQLKEGNKIVGGEPGSSFAYINLTDVSDDTELELQFISLSKNKVLFNTTLTVRCDDRLANIEIVCALPHLIVPETGVYAFEIVSEGEIIGSHRVRGVVRN